MALRIEDYALIGDCKSAALVGVDGSIDWLTWPRFDSAACFAALLGTPDNGRWINAPTETPVAVSRRYRPGTLILETEFETKSGKATVIDFMPPADGRGLIRIVVGQTGKVDLSTEFVARFEYGATVPWVTRLDDGGISAVASPDRLVLRSDSKLRGEDLRTVGDFNVKAGKSVAFALSYGASFEDPPKAIDPFASPEAHGKVLAPMERSLSRCRAVDRGRQTLRHHIESPDVRADRRNCRGGDYVPARRDRRGKKLGLSVLLVTECDLHDSGSAKTRIFGRSPSVARLARSSDRRQSGASADHVWSRWGKMAAGAYCSVVAWLRELRSSAYWQRGG